jgi:hypothetical protein
MAATVVIPKVVGEASQVITDNGKDNGRRKSSGGIGKDNGRRKSSGKEKEVMAKETTEFNE